jgi:hypothetical protein
MYKQFAKVMGFDPIVSNSVLTENRNLINEKILNSCNFSYFSKKIKKISALVCLRLINVTNAKNISNILSKTVIVKNVQIIIFIIITSKYLEN